ncbi:MerR family transcriptional regulator [Crossiella cryophila]|uniref:DNA-binding transcriptional MerR regulator n=1 Tax=Crossiella cryophila TaxID=43355 RepID=A0A7W7FTG3_9PSEU|nr:MerR family transcriptional regulator [Crossiella cryophila]MBB4678141.1 DNA-binding transcriptional MerR regulator [Crossiella cryophila]
MDFSIGELARRTGLTVKAIRFYSDQGLVPAERDPGGFRRYDRAALARLELIRTLRALDLDLPAIRRILDRELTLPEVAATHAAALATQIRTLTQRHAVLRVAAARGADAGELDRLHRLATLTRAERDHLVEDFLAELPDNPVLTGLKRTLTPELPENPDTAQIEAWLELAELTADPGFRATLRQLAGRQEPVLRRDPIAVVRELVAPALAAGIEPDQPAARPVVLELQAGWPRAELLARLTAAADPRRERYVRLLAIVNGWQAPEPLAPTLDWAIRALRSTVDRAAQ